MASTPDYASQILADVRAQIALDDEILSETKSRNLVKRVARRFLGALKTFDSGSVAHGTVNCPVADADCGVVLDRRTYPELGRDGDDLPPDAIVAEIAAFALEGVQYEYPEATCRICKRAILIEFHEPLDDDQDPSVDLIIALTRAEGGGRWIPNTETHHWDASDPEKHTELLNGPDAATRVHRARVIRLAKAAVKQDATPVVSSVNLEALALEHVDADTTIAESLRDLLLGAADDLGAGLTPDPAGVSAPIKLPDGVSRTMATDRLRELGDAVDDAVKAAGDPQRARAALARVFPGYIGADMAGKHDLAHALSVGEVTAITAAFGAGASRLKATRAYGHAGR